MRISWFLESVKLFGVSRILATCFILSSVFIYRCHCFFCLFGKWIELRLPKEDALTRHLAQPGICTVYDWLTQTKGNQMCPFQGDVSNFTKRVRSDSLLFAFT